MTLQRNILALTLAGGLATLAVLPAAAQLAEPATPSKLKWSFAGPFGKYDEGQLQRGYKIYHDVCSTCHGMSLVAFRNLADPGRYNQLPEIAGRMGLDTTRDRSLWPWWDRWRPRSPDTATSWSPGW